MTDQVFIPKFAAPLTEEVMQKLANNRSIHLVVRDSEGNTVFDSNEHIKKQRPPVEIPSIKKAIEQVYGMSDRIHGEFCISSDNCRCDEEATALLKAFGVTDEQIKRYEEEWRDE